MIRTTIALLGLSLGAACGGPDIRFAAPASVPSERIASVYDRIEVIQVGLPIYATTEEIVFQDATGAITPTEALWADEPARAVTLQLSRDLAALTGALVAPEPWPFRDFPDAQVDVRVEDFVATAAGTFVLTGQYFVAPEEEAQGPDRAVRFSLSAPIVGEAGPRAIAAARNAAVTQLAQQIAANGLR
ncbi:membrane integrity-associated transporter subunit PqiC [Citreimonas sp.]|uniref:PqiC family protein n=1 Tax=Citreimonas sp. TaxID=3036715 RepID=UPI0035C815AB